MASRKHVFTSIEKKVFMDILRNFSHIVENKQTDGSTLREKNVAWERITREYNASPHVTTEVSNKQLKRLWMNLKQRQREAITKERQHRMATGGGPSTSSANIDPDVAQIAPGLMVEVPGAIDSDSTFVLDSEDVSINMDIDSNQPDCLHIPESSSAIYNLQPDMRPPSPYPTTTTTPPLITLPIITTTPPPPPPRITTPPPPRITTPPPPRSTTAPPLRITTPPPPRSTTAPPLRITTPPPPRITTPPPPRSTTAPHPSTLSTLPLPNTIPLPSRSTSSTSLQRHKITILEKEYRDRLNRASEIHAMEKELLLHKIREAKAKADLSELLLQQERSREDTERLPDV